MRNRAVILTIPATIFHVVVAALIIGVIIATAILTRPASQTVAPKPPETTVRSSAGGCYGSGSAPYGIPPGCIFGLHDMRFLVTSQFAYESGLVPGVIGDYDYGLGYGVQEVVTLPGGKWDHYAYRGSAYIPGSGTGMLFTTPNGGAFAFFHIAVGYLRAAALPPVRTALTAPVSRQLSGDEATVLAMEAMPRAGPPASGYLPGGTKVGLSGWPSSLEYSNGSCYDAVSCQADSHLCLSLSDLARQWFWQVANGQDKPPKPKKPKRKPFPRKAWGSRPFRDKHGRLTFAASQWIKHQTLGKFTGHQRWHAKTHTMTYRFARGGLECNFRRHTCKVTR